MRTRMSHLHNRARHPAGRHELLESEGLEHHQEIPAYALSELTLKYKRPLRSQDAFLITVATAATGRAKVEFEQRIIRLDGGTPDNDAVRCELLATPALFKHSAVGAVGSS